MRQEKAIVARPEGLLEARAFVDAIAEQAGFDAAERYQITMAANEAVSNALEHGSPCIGGRVHVSAEVGADALALAVRDCGRFAAGSAEPDRIAERGRGFAFMNLMMDEVRLDAAPGRTTVRLVKRRGPEPEVAPPDAAAPGNVEAVGRLIDAFARRDAAALMRLVDLGVVFEPLSTAVSQRLPYLGRSGMRQYLDDLEETWDEFEVELLRARPLGSHVVALCRIRARAGTWRNEGLAGMVWRLRDGLAVWGKVYATEAEALDAAGLRRR